MTGCSTDPPQNYAIHIRTVYNGGPEDIENFITKPIEKALTNFPDAIRMESISKTGISIVMLEFKGSTDRKEKKRQVVDAVNKLVDEKNFPQNLSQEPHVYIVDESYWPVVTVDLENKSMDPLAFEECVMELQEEILAENSIANVTVTGASERYVLINLNEEKLKKAKLEPDEVSDFLAYQLTGTFDFLNGSFANLKSMEDWKFEKITTAGFTIRIDVGSFSDGSISTWVMDGNCPVSIGELADEILYCGEKKAPYTVSLQISKQFDKSTKEIVELVKKILKKKERNCLGDYTVTERPESDSPRDVFDIYAESEADCYFEIDRDLCMGWHITPGKVAEEIFDIKIIYPQITCDEILETEIICHSYEGELFKVPIKDFILNNNGD